MSPKRVLQYTGIALYCLITCNAFLFTMTRWQMPFIPKHIAFYSYGMMSPWQGYPRVNTDLRALGRLPNGSWEEIDLDPYSPAIRGNQIMHRMLMSYFVEDEGQIPYDGYTLFAQKLLELERTNKPYDMVRVYLVHWPLSPKGWDTLRTADETTQYLLAEAS